MVEFGDPTAWLQLLSQREAVQLRRQEMELSRQQQQFDRAMTEERLDLGRRSQIESEMNSEVMRRLHEENILESQQKKLLYERGARALESISGFLGQAQSPMDLERAMASAETVMGKSKAFKEIRSLPGGLSEAGEILGKGFMSLADGFAAHPDRNVRLDLAAIGTNPESRLFKMSSDTHREKWRAIPGKELTTLAAQVNATQDPEKLVEQTMGMSPGDFKVAGASVMASLAEHEKALRDPRLHTEDSKEEVAVYQNSIRTKRQVWDQKLQLVDRMERNFQKIASGERPQVSLAIESDIGEHYETFAKHVVKHGPLPMAAMAIEQYAKTGYLPKQILEDITNPIMFDQPDSAYRMATMIDVYRRNDSSASQKLVDALKDDPRVLGIVDKINGWRDINRKREIAAFSAQDPEQQAALVTANYIEAYASAVTGMSAAEALGVAATEDSSRESNTKTPVTVGGVQVTITNPAQAVTPRAFARSLMRKPNSFWTSSVERVFRFSELSAGEQTALTDQFQWLFEDALAKQEGDVGAAHIVAQNELQKRWGPHFVGKKMGGSVMANPPKTLAMEQGVDLPEEVADSWARIQLEAEVIAPYNKRHGTKLTIADVEVVSVIGVTDGGVQQNGYYVTSGGAGLNSQIWFPEFKDRKIPDGLGVNQDVLKIRESEIDRSFEDAADRRRDTEARWQRAMRNYRDRPSAANRSELDKAEELIMKIEGIWADQPSGGD